MAELVLPARYLNDNAKKLRRIDMRKIDCIDMDQERVLADLTLLWAFFRNVRDLESKFNPEKPSS
jgi:hypothetical protein